MEKIRVGVVGLGRLGWSHAENIAFRVPGAELAAVCALEPERLEQARRELGVARAYQRFEDLLADRTLAAVWIASSSAEHCRQICAALEAGFHVFSEKPLGLDLAECETVRRAVEARPDRVFMLGFMRRYDASYRRVKQLADAGHIGAPILFRGYTVDPESAIAGALRFAPSSGGQFLDMSVHDIDLARWLIGSEVRSLYAAGGCYAHQEFAAYGDGDNLAALLRFRNGAMAFLLAGRTAAHGYAVESELIGTKGSLRVASVPQANLVEVLDGRGVVRECSQSFLERFQEAFLAEAREFTDCLRQGRRPEVGVRDGTEATRVAAAAMESFRTDRLVRLGEG